MRRFTTPLLVVLVLSAACGRSTADGSADGAGNGPGDAGVADAGPSDGPIAVLLPVNLDFGEVDVGETARRELTLSNDGDADLVVSSASAPGPFAVAAPGAPIPPGATESVWVSATPTGPGSARGTLTVETNGGDRAVDLVVYGVALRPDLRVTAPEAFGAVAPGATLSRTLRFENAGNAVVSLEALELEGGSGGPADPAFAMETPALPYELAPGASVDVPITFTPADEGTHLVEVHWASDDPAHPSGTVALSGTGDGPALALAPETLDLGTVAVGTWLRHRVTLTNGGAGPLHVSAVSIDGDAFEVDAPTLPLTLARGAALAVEVRFVPSAVGFATARLVVASDDPVRPEQMAALTGHGVAERSGCVVEGPAPASLVLPVPLLEPRRAYVSVRNAGSAECLVGHAAFLPGSAPSFTLVGAPDEPVALPPGAVLTFAVDAPPLQAATAASLRLYVSDPARPELVLPIGGVPAPTDVVFASDLDLGPALVGCRGRTGTLCVVSPLPAVGVAAPVVAGVDLVETFGGTFDLLGPPVAGTVLRGRTCFGVRWSATSPGPAQGVVRLRLKNRTEPVTAWVQAEGVEARATERFAVSTGGKADIVFVVDDSGSMWERYVAAENAASFLDGLTHLGIDYHLAVATTDVSFGGRRGRFLPEDGSRLRVVDASLPEPLATFQANLLAVGEDGDASRESPLEGAWLGLTRPRAIDPATNAGFLRPDARLVVIAIVDEPDQSSETADFYLEAYRSLHGLATGAPDPVVLAVESDVTPDYLPTRLPELAARTGGTIFGPAWAGFVEVTDVAARYLQLGRSVWPQGRYHPAAPPDPATIEVTSGGASLTGWSWDAAAGAVVFDPAALPPDGTTVDVGYVPACN